MTFIEAIILAIIEGLTEFLPVSSTGHMIIASTFMGNASDSFVKLFTVAIQFGAILSVVLVYFKKFIKSINFYVLLFVAFLPTGIIGLSLKSYVDALLEEVVVVAISLLVGGVVLLFVDKYFAKNETEGTEEVSYKTAFIIGIIQSIAMIPGSIKICRNDYRRNVSKAYPKGRCRIFIFLGGSYHVCCYRKIDVGRKRIID